MFIFPIFRIWRETNYHVGGNESLRKKANRKGYRKDRPEIKGGRQGSWKTATPYIDLSIRYASSFTIIRPIQRPHCNRSVEPDENRSSFFRHTPINSRKIRSFDHRCPSIGIPGVPAGRSLLRGFGLPGDLRPRFGRFLVVFGCSGNLRLDRKR